MTTTRSLINTLEITFKDPIAKEKLRFSAKQSFNKNLGATRAFDEFPQLLSETKMYSLKKSFKNLFLLITKIDQNFQITDEKEKKAIEVWVKKIIQIGIAELVTREGKIKKEVIDLLGWQDIKIKTSEVLKGFVGAIHAQIITSESYEDYQPEIKTAIFNYLNNYEKWVSEELKAHKNKMISTYDFFKGSAPSLFVGTLALGGTAYMLYNQWGMAPKDKRENVLRV